MVGIRRWTPGTGSGAEGGREPDRLAAFSDGVLAVIITIMALELQPPAAPTLHALGAGLPALLVYLLSFTAIGIYWVHHHLLRATRRINGAVMWANLHMLFWLSLIPVLTEWMGRYCRAHLPAAAWGVASVGAAVAYVILERAIIRCNGRDSALARAIGSQRKGDASITLYLIGIGLAWVSPWISYGLYVVTAVIWFIPDRRLDRSGSADGS